MLAGNLNRNRSDRQTLRLGVVSLLAYWALLLCLGCGHVGSDSEAQGTLESIQPQLVTSRGEIHFLRDLETGRSLAAEKGLPCLLFFTADWCTYCHDMEETAFTDPVVARMSKSFVCVLVDADQEKEVCKQFSVSGYPTIQFLSSQGRVLNRLVGRQSATELAAGMQAALKRFAWLNDSPTQLR